jgi:hypothetical protein
MRVDVLEVYFPNGSKESFSLEDSSVDDIGVGYQNGCVTGYRRFKDEVVFYVGMPLKYGYRTGDAK